MFKNAITPTRQENFPEWYQQVIKNSNLAENSPLRGCMIIKPWGYTIWENIQEVLDKMFKDTGHSNAYFPLLIPLSFLEKKAKYINGFAKECAVVTHHKLEQDKNGKLIPSGKLEEPLIIRPTSETIIGDASRRDSINQKDKKSFSLSDFISQIGNILEEIQNNINDFKEHFSSKKNDSSGFIICYSNKEREELLKELKITARCIPFEFNQNNNIGKCIFTGKKTKTKIIYARSY